MRNKFNVLFAFLLVVIFISFCATISLSQVTDKDGNTYKTVTIGTQEWTAENLKVEHYRNGDVIPQVQDKEQWKKLTTGAWCYYESSTENGTTYGKLYNWYAVNDSRGLAPEGWHIPSDAEWTTLIEFLGGSKDAGEKIKSTELWKDIKWATNESGFSAIPGGLCDENYNYKFIGKHACFWSSTSNNTVASWIREMHNNLKDVKRDTFHKRYGLSVRCIKD
ncbi:MAG: fibrobacter succinogenes major paralogous domain-containing protein [Ignavibacteriae bacterium]|nr:fibrobacter succinogenes major paralogous domain-containing protein [Ignavibacteriota bacterium]